jgi:Zn-dependent protease
MPSNVRLGQVRGIPIELHWSLFLVFGLLTISLAGGYFPDTYPSLSSGTNLLLGLVTSALALGGILLHELGHALVALRERIGVRSITLYVFGGIAQLEEEPKSAGAEFRVAAAGPLVSFALAGLFGLLYLLDRGADVLAAPSLYLARINLVLALFNLIPGFPLDGGRILRAVVWGATGSQERAARVAAASGQVVGFGFFAIGALLALSGNLLNGLWLVFIGWFIQNAATATAVQSGMERMLAGVTAAQAMRPGPPVVPSRTMLRQLVDEHVLGGGGQRFFVVSDDGTPRGVVSLTDVVRTPRDRWDWTNVTQIMVPWARTIRVRPDTGLLDALHLMSENSVHQVPVADGDVIRGVLSREQVLGQIRLRSQLGVKGREATTRVPQ